MLKNLILESEFVSGLRYLLAAYDCVATRLRAIYKNSQTHRLLLKLWDTAKAHFGYSFIGIMTDLEHKDRLVVLRESRGIKIFKRCKEKITYYLITSKSYALEGLIRNKLCGYPLKSASIIIVMAVLVNMFFSILFKNTIGTMGLIMRGLLLFVGISTLFANTSWQAIEENSIILKLFFKVRCAESAGK